MSNEYVMEEHPAVKELICKLPYQLTNAQTKVWQEISENMKSDTVMSRLVRRCWFGKDYCSCACIIKYCYEWISGGNDGADRSIGKAAL